MINALYEPFPDHITADGHTYPIVTDFRDWLRFSDMLTDQSIPDEEKMELLPEWLLEEPVRSSEELVAAMFAFYRAKGLERDVSQDEQTATPESAIRRPPVFSWVIDARYVLGDFRRFYGIDLLTVEYMHWWEFKTLFAALPDDSACQKRIAYRSCDISAIKNAAERKRIIRIQQQIAIPFELDEDAIADELGGAI